MKRINFLIVIALLNFYSDLNAQSIESISSIPLVVSYNKTTNIIFPYSIQSVDMGSRDLLAQKVNGIENILQVKAAKENFDETNLSVITADGKLYFFVVNYSQHPSILNFRISEDSDINKIVSSYPAQFDISKSNSMGIETTAKNIEAKKRIFYRVKDKSYGMRFFLKSLYIDNDVFYFQLEVDNKTNINYDIDVLNFFIKDKKQAKRTAVQELQQTPLYVYNDPGFVRGHTKQTMVIAIQKFTIPDKKLLVVQLMEKNGGRNLSIKLNNKTIIKAKTIFKEANN